MHDYTGHVIKVTRITLFFLSLCLVVWALMPSIRPQVGGLMVGVVASIVNGIFLAWKVNRVGQAAIEPSKRKTGLGFLTRAAVVVLSVIVSERLHLSLAATVAGLFSFQLATLLLGIITLRKKPE